MLFLSVPQFNLPNLHDYYSDLLYVVCFINDSKGGQTNGFYG